MTTIITKNSSTASAVPVSGDLTQGELAVNVTDKKLYTKNSGGSVVELGTNPGSLTLSGGTANGVLYLNGSKVATSGSALTFDGTTFSAPNSVITSSSSSDALRITQTGTGNALLVEDSANPDATPFVIDANARIIQGNTTALSPFLPGNNPFIQQHGLSSQGASTLQANWQNSATSQPAIYMFKSRSATVGTYSAVSSGDNLGVITWTGDNGSAPLAAASIFGEVDTGTVSATSMPGALSFRTVSDGSTTQTERMRIDSSGNVGIGTSSPAKKLDVNGDASIYGITVGRGAGAVSTNTAVGASALAANTTGSSNTAVGSEALLVNTTASNNTAVGILALSASNGGNNTAIGDRAMLTNTSGSENTALGRSALRLNTVGVGNTGLGYNALYNNTTASNNTAVGYQAAYTASTVPEITAIGYRALYSTTVGYTTAVGSNALQANTTGTFNVALGREAGYSNTTGSNNTFIGYQSLTNNTTGSSNVAVGHQSLNANTTVSYNTAVGYQAGYSNATGTHCTYIGNISGLYGTGSYNTGCGSRTYEAASFSGTDNTAIGYGAGNSLTTGSFNSLLGRNAGAAISTGSKNTIIGYYNGNQGGLDIRTASNYIVLSDGDGNPRGIFDGGGRFLFNTQSSILSSAGAQFVGSSTFSNAVLAQSLNGNNAFVVTNQSGTSQYNAMQFCNNGATFSGTGSISISGTSTAYNTSSDYRLKENIAPMTGALAKVQQLKPVTYKWKSDGSNGEGFIAHELAEVCPDAVTGEKDAVDENGNIKPQGIDTSFLIATLTAAIQELKAEFDAYKATHP